MTDDLTERVARAIHGAFGDGWEAMARAAIEAIPGWQPIETAPLEELGLLWGPDVRSVSAIGHIYEHTDGSRDASSAMLHGFKITHWHALPEPPK